MPKKLVIDANFVLALISTEEYSDIAEKVYNLIKSKEIIAYAPVFLIVEVLNILIKKKKVDTETVKDSLNRLKKSGIVFLDTDNIIKNTTDLEDLVIQYNITSYDALYLMTSLKYKCKLLTVDQELLKIKNLTIDLRSFEIKKLKPKIDPIEAFFEHKKKLPKLSHKQIMDAIHMGRK